LRRYVRCMVWRVRPGAVGNRTRPFGIPLLPVAASQFIRLETQFVIRLETQFAHGGNFGNSPSDFVFHYISPCCVRDFSAARSDGNPPASQIAACVSPPRTQAGCSMPSSPPSRAASEWGYRSAARSWKRTEDDCQHRVRRAPVQRFKSSCLCIKRMLCRDRTPQIIA
jgi:hypothetical protein